MSDIRKIPFDFVPRLESGPVQFGEDWPGLFIRGDHAFYFAMQLEELLAHPDSILARAVVEGLLSDLKSCRI